MKFILLTLTQALACSYLANDPITSGDQTRSIMVTHQFINDYYRLHASLLASSQAAVEVFKSTNSQKFFMRQMRGADSVIQKRAIKGAANLQKVFSFKETSAILLTLYAHMLLMSKSYSGALCKFSCHFYV